MSKPQGNESGRFMLFAIICIGMVVLAALIVVTIVIYWPPPCPASFVGILCVQAPPQQPQLHWKQVQFVETVKRNPCSGHETIWSFCDEGRALNDICVDLMHSQYCSNITEISEFNIIDRQRTFYIPMNMTIEKCAWAFNYGGFQERIIKTSNLTVAYCDGAPEECNERFGMPANAITCHAYDLDYTGEMEPCTVDNGFQCEEWAYSQYEDDIEWIASCDVKEAKNKFESIPDIEYLWCERPVLLYNYSSECQWKRFCQFRIKRGCINSSLSVNGPCEDAIKLYGGVCDG